MKNLIVGGSGFLGLKLAKTLLEKGESTAITFSKNKPDLKDCKMIKVNITSTKEVSNAFKKTRPQKVFHLSALTNVDVCEKEKKTARRLNVAGTQTVLEECVKTGAKFLVDIYIKIGNLIFVV